MKLYLLITNCFNVFVMSEVKIIVSSFLREHEWNKHGTCAYNLPTLQGEMNYFTSAMNLYQTINLFGSVHNASYLC